jgi:hypothetical protein
MSCPPEEYSIAFRVRTADLEELDNISDLTIEQTVDMIWEGKVTMSINMDEKGVWNIENKEYSYPQSRLRFEVKKGDSFVALIDGPIVNIDADMKSEPGQSSMTLTIYDDSILLDNNEECLHFHDKKDSEIAFEIYYKAYTDGILGSFEIEDTKLEPQIINFRGTRMQLLRKLAKRNMMHAYVLPGKTSGKSIGCFKPYPDKPSGLTDLVLTGESRNIESFRVNIDSLRPSITQGAYLNSLDNRVQNFSQDYQKFDLHGDFPVISNINQLTGQITPAQTSPQHVIHPNLRMIHPSSSLGNDMEQRIKAEVYESGYAIEGTGQVLQMESKFPDILTPYNLIIVKGINGPYCGEYIITKVSHKITRLSHTQSFTMIRNAFSKLSRSLEPAGGNIF